MTSKRVPVLPVGVLLALMALAIGVLCYLYFGSGSATVRRLANPPGLVREIQRLSEMVTVKYSVQKVVGLEEQKAPLGSEKLLLIVQARVLGGVKLDTLTEHDVAIGRDGAVVIRLPPAEILHVYLDENETRVWDRSITWWTPWVPYNPNLETQARLVALEEVRERVLEMGILDEAERNAQATIRSLLQAAGVNSVVFQPSS